MRDLDIVPSFMGHQLATKSTKPTIENHSQIVKYAWPVHIPQYSHLTESLGQYWMETHLRMGVSGTYPANSL